MGGNIAHEFSAFLLPRNTETSIHPFGGKLTGGSRGTLVKQTQAVPHAAVGKPGKHPGGAVVQVNVLLIGHILQSRRNVLLADAPEGKTLAPGQNRGRNLVKLGGCQDEQQMLRRLLNDFKQCVEGGNGQHVYLIDDIHTHFHL